MAGIGTELEREVVLEGERSAEKRDEPLVLEIVESRYVEESIKLISSSRCVLFLGVVLRNGGRRAAVRTANFERVGQSGERNNAFRQYSLFWSSIARRTFCCSFGAL